MTVTTRSASRHGSSSPAKSSSSRDSPSRTSSDGGSRERPVRKKLQKTSITGPKDLPKPATAENHVDTEETTALEADPDDDKKVIPKKNGDRGRVRRKRSFEDLEEEQACDTEVGNVSKHLRKRSRDSDDDEKKDNGNPTTPDGKTAVLDSTVKSGENGNDGAQPEAENNEMQRSSSLSDGVVDVSDSTTEQPLLPQKETVEDNVEGERKPQAEDGPHEHILDTKSDELALSTASAVAVDTTSSVESERQEEDSELKSSADNSKPPSATDVLEKNTTQLPSSSGFGNTSEQSPFGTLAQKSSSSANSQTSASAFAASGFASLAANATSPFAALGSANSSKADDAATEAKTFGTGTTNGFGALAGSKPSVFGAQAGFGSLGAAFGSASGFGTGPSLKSFASPEKLNILSTKPTKQFGATSDEDAEEGEIEGEDEHENDTGGFGENGLKDERFHEQDVETGEEDEVTVFQSRAKLYMSVDKQWKERGVGNFKVNMTRPDLWPETDEVPKKRRARFIMRADGSHRIVLNSPITKEIKVTDPAGGPPKGKTAIFLGFVVDKPTMMQLKMRSNEQTEKLHRTVTDIQRDI